MLKIIYDPQIKNWLSADSIKKLVQKTRSKGMRKLVVIGNLREDIQLTLLKLLEDHPEVVLTTSVRLIDPIESRALSIENKLLDYPVDVAFLGISRVSLRAAEDLTGFYRRFRNERHI